jgi:hypothetical protein
MVPRHQGGVPLGGECAPNWVPRCQVTSSQVKPSQAKSGQAKPSQVKPGQSGAPNCMPRSTRTKARPACTWPAAEKLFDASAAATLAYPGCRGVKSSQVRSGRTPPLLQRSPLPCQHIQDVRRVKSSQVSPAAHSPLPPVLKARSAYLLLMNAIFASRLALAAGLHVLAFGCASNSALTLALPRESISCWR